jgi:hypothetical protein
MVESVDLFADVAQVKDLAIKHTDSDLSVYAIRKGDEIHDVKEAAKCYVESRKVAINELTICCDSLVDMYDILVAFQEIACDVKRMDLTISLWMSWNVSTSTHPYYKQSYDYIVNKRQKLQQLNQGRPNADLFGKALKSYARLQRLEVAGMMEQSYTYTSEEFLKALDGMDSIKELHVNDDTILSPTDFVTLTRALPALQGLQVWSIAGKDGYWDIGDFVEDVAVQLEKVNLSAAMPALVQLWLTSPDTCSDDDEEPDSVDVSIGDLRMMLRLFPSLRKFCGMFKWEDSNDPTESELEAFCGEDPRARELYTSMTFNEI